MRALVTGGAGFIGSNIADALLARGDEVTVLDDLSTGFAENVPAGARFVQGGINDADALADACTGVDVVFHQAALRAVFRSVEHPLDTDRVNCAGTLAVLLAARDAGARRVVQASSSSVYGGAAEMPTPETSPLLPRSPYAVSKLTGEHYARVCHELYGLETVALRYFNVFGPRQRPDSQYAAVIPLFMDALHRGTAPTVHGDGRQSRDFTYISDVVAANLAAASAPAAQCAGKAYNIAGGHANSLLDLLEVLYPRLGKVEPVHVDPRPGDVRHTKADPTLAKADLDFTCEVSFADGMDLTVDWFLAR